MKRLLMLVAGAFFALPAFSQSPAADCAKARDPERCEALQAALISCSEKRGAEKRACLDASLPPIDCSKTQNPQHCEAAQKAKEVCKGKINKELKKCLGVEEPTKKHKKAKTGKTTKKTKASKTTKTTKTKKAAKTKSPTVRKPAH
jgi:hypothetical protein